MPVNLGTGQGVTVRELVSAFERASGQALPHGDAPRRAGDSAGACAETGRAKTLLDWSAGLSTEAAIRDALRWNELRPARLGGS